MASALRRLYFVPDPLARLCHEELKELLRKLLEGFLHREREVITLRFGLSGERPMTLEKVGKRLATTREYVRRNQARAMSKFRKESRLRFLAPYYYR